MVHKLLTPILGFISLVYNFKDFTFEQHKRSTNGLLNALNFT